MAKEGSDEEHVPEEECAMIPCHRVRDEKQDKREAGVV